MTGTEKQFIIHEHKTSDGVHWDLMLEEDDHLATYRLDSFPQDASTSPINAEKIFDHPLKFLTYEGSVNKGLGSVEIVEKGKYQILQEEASKKQIEFDGCIIKGIFTLQHIESDKWQIQPR